MTDREEPHYPHRIIGSLNALARVLGVSVSELQRLAKRADKFYRPGKLVIKPGKKPRPTRKAIGPLHAVQERILHNILRKVEYPSYLHGGIRGGHGRSRSPISNARAHLGAASVVDLDIESFFPSLDALKVKRIWREFFGFPEDVAECLTSLTTELGHLPQGASPSTYLANLVFFDREPLLANEFGRQGLRYTRFIDDITISSGRHMSPQLVELACTRVIGMMTAWGLIHSKDKFAVTQSVNRLLVSKLGINSNRVAVPKQFRKNVRAAVQTLRKVPLAERTTPTYKQLYDRASGQTSYFRQLHFHEGSATRDALRGLRPRPSDEEVAQLRRRVVHAVRLRRELRMQPGYRKNLDSLASTVGMIRHARPREAGRLLRLVRVARERR